MKKSEFKDKIKTLVKQVYKPTSNVDLDSSAQVDISLESEKFPVLLRFPELKRVLVDLLTEQYEIFVKDIQWVAPKPTTFRIVLANDETFLLIWAVRSWICTVEGKRYYLLNLSEEERATEAIARILAYGNGQAEAPADGELTASESSSTKAGAGDFPGGDGGEDVGGEEEIEITDTETTTEEPAEEA